MPKLKAMHAKHSISTAASSLQDVIDSAEDILENVAERKGEAADRLRERLSDAVSKARVRLRDLDLPESIPEAYENGKEFVRTNPWKAAAVAGIAVLAVTLLLRGASDAD